MLSDIDDVTARDVYDDSDERATRYVTRCGDDER